MVGKNLCCGCMACAQTCPRECIEMIKDNNGFWKPQIDQDACIKCNQCEKVCPVLNITSLEQQKIIDNVILCANISESILMESSSGGVFSALANSVLRENGIVCGAAFSDDYRYVHHVVIQNKEDIHKLVGSKYVQSEIEDCYKLIKKNAEAGRKVLFCGSPCQVGALKLYLGKSDLENVFLIDFICHGVPSQKVYEKYIGWAEKKYGSQISEVNFRSKESSWKQFSLKLVFNNSVMYQKLYDLDPYGQAFVTNTSLNELCYSCLFRTESRASDLTLADAWGLSDYYQIVKRNKGASIVFVHTTKGMQRLNQINDELITEKLNDSDRVRQTSRLTEGHKKPENRDMFFSSLDSLEFDKLVKKYAPYGIKKKVRLLVKEYLGK